MSRSKKTWVVVLILLLVAVAYLARTNFRVDALIERVQGLGPWGPVVYILVYLLAPSLLIPGSPITIAGGALFGPVWGTVYTIIGATGGACLAFLIARYVAEAWVEKKTAGIFKKLREGVEKEGWRFVAFTRLIPLFPFNLLNYAFGLTSVKFSHYAVASFFCMLPGAAAYTYIGYAGREAARGGEDLVIKITTAIGLLIFVSMLPRLIRTFRSPA